MGFEIRVFFDLCLFAVGLCLLATQKAVSRRTLVVYCARLGHANNGQGSL